MRESAIKGQHRLGCWHPCVCVVSSCVPTRACCGGWAWLLNGAQIVVWDFDKLQPNDRIGTHFLDFKAIEKMPGGMPPTWLNIYGAPEGVKVGKNKNAMNKYPDQATNYRYVCVSTVAAVGAVSGVVMHAVVLLVRPTCAAAVEC